MTFSQPPPLRNGAFDGRREILTTQKENDSVSLQRWQRLASCGHRRGCGAADGSVEGPAPVLVLMLKCKPRFIKIEQISEVSIVQKFSSIHMLPFIVQRSNSRWRPSGEGCANVSKEIPAFSHMTCALP